MPKKVRGVFLHTLWVPLKLAGSRLEKQGVFNQKGFTIQVLTLLYFFSLNLGSLTLRAFLANQNELSQGTRCAKRFNEAWHKVKLQKLARRGES